MNRYTVHGLVIASEFALPCTDYPGAGDADVHIRLGNVPKGLARVQTGAGWFEQDDSQCLMTIERVGRFLIRDGNSIVIQSRADMDPATLALWVSGPAMGALLHQRGALPLHATALMTERGAILVGGGSGIGKSTTAAALVRAGCRLISDDISAIQLDDAGTPWVQPGNRQQKLWYDAIQRLDLHERPWERLWAYDGKYAALLDQASCADKGQVTAIYVLCTAGEQVAVRTLSGRAKLERLGTIIYRPELMTGGPLRLRQMQILSALAVRARVADVLRPPGSDTIDAVARALIHDQPS